MRPLIWKELRQGRPLLLFSVIAALALAAAHVVVVRLKEGQGYGGGPGAGLEAPLTAVLVVLPLFLALLAGSGLFAAETDHGTVPVLFALPLSRRRIWALKALCGLLLAGAACALLLGISRWLMAPVYDRLPLRPWPDLALSALVVFAIALFTTVLTPHVVGATIAAIPLAIALAIGGLLAGDPFGGMLLGYDKYLETELWAALAVPALLFASVRAVVRGELLEWNRSALLQLPVVLAGLALSVVLVSAAGRALTSYSRQSVRDIIAEPVDSNASVAALLSYSRPVPYQRGKTMAATGEGERSSWQSGSHFEPRPLDWGDITSGKLDGGPLYRNISAVLLDLRTGRELGVVRQPLNTYWLDAAVSPDGSVAAVASAPRGLTWGCRPWNGLRLLTIVDLETGKRLYWGVPAPLREKKGGAIGAMAWSPHGKYLAVEMEGRTYLLRRDGRSLRALPVRLGGGQAAWSPAEEVLYATGEGGLSRIEAATGRVEVRWRPEASLGSNSLALLPGGISPDDRWVAVISSESPAAQGEVPGATTLLAVPTGKGEAQTTWRSAQPAVLSGAWSRDGRTLYALAGPQEGRGLSKAPRPPAARLLRWQAGDAACTELAASLPYPAATLTPLADNGMLVYPVRQFEEKQYTMRHEPLPPTGGPFVVEASGAVRPFPDAASSLEFAADNDLVAVDAAGRVITVEGRPGSKVVRATEVGTGRSVAIYP